MNKFQRSWQLFQTSLLVLRRDTRLLWFPIITTSCTVLIAVLFLVPVAFQSTGNPYTSAEHWEAVGNSIYGTSPSQTPSAESDGTLNLSRSHRVQSGGLKPLAVGYFAVIYFVSMFTATFFNVAFYKEILNALAGQPVSFADGIRFACSKWKIILMWTLFAGVVGYIIKALERRFGFVGQLVMRLVGAAWSIACVFVIPVIITAEETSNPLTVLKRSAWTLRQTWGESLIGYVGVSFGGALVALFSVCWLGGGVSVAMVLHAYWLIALVVLVWLMALFLWSYVLSVASQIFRCALFVYASKGSLPEPYTHEMMALAWKTKKK
ncbi:MAG TPA: DUF6159 family protein [Candidatus Acidoferrum sp.]|jgi:hypothetical protein|nr:DUF6159 family protein [Candidatus Acidoferrum sp.]